MKYNLQKKGKENLFLSVYMISIHFQVLGTSKYLLYSLTNAHTTKNTCNQTKMLQMSKFQYVLSMTIHSFTGTLIFQTLHVSNIKIAGLWI